MILFPKIFQDIVPQVAVAYHRNKMKIKIFVFLFIVFLIGVGLIFLQTKPKTTPTPKTVSGPSIPNPIKGRVDYELLITEKEFDFPKEAPILKKDDLLPISQDEAKSIAKGLGFEDDPIIANDILEGETYIWNSDSALLTIWSKTRKIDYSLSRTPDSINKQLSDSTLLNTSQEFLANYFGLSSENLKFNNFTYWEKASGVSGLIATKKGQANYYQLNFYPKTSEYVLLTLNPDKTPYYVWLLPDGTVYRVSITDPGNLIPTEDKYPLKSFADVQKSPQDAIVVSLDNGNIELTDVVQGSIQKISISKIQLAYLLDSFKSTFYQPVYLLTGTTNISGTKENIQVSLYLPAIAQP